MLCVSCVLCLCLRLNFVYNYYVAAFFGKNLILRIIEFFMRIIGILFFRIE